MKTDPSLDQQSLTSQYRQFLLFRILVVLLSFGMVGFHQFWGGFFFGKYASYLHGILSFYLLFGVAVWLFFGRNTVATYRQVRLHLSGDFLFQSALVFASGGVQSIFTPVLIVTLVAATTLITRRDSYVFSTSIALMLVVTTVLFQLEDAAEHKQATMFAQVLSPQVPAYLLGSVAGLYIAAALGNRYSQGFQRVQREMRVATEKIRELEDLQVMALGIAHEIRNPLASIRGCVQELGRIAPAGGREQKFMDIICRESGRLDRIIEDFLRYARPDRAALVPTELVSVVDEAVVLLRQHEDLQGRSIHWNPIDARYVIRGSRDHLVQLFLNLGINALQATDPQSGEISIRVVSPSLTKGENGDQVVVEWEDNGVGISAAVRDKLFMPFFSMKEQGRGLGLSIVARVVKEHGGNIDLRSESGDGAVFLVDFPIASAREEQKENDVELTARNREVSNV